MRLAALFSALTSGPDHSKALCFSARKVFSLTHAVPTSYQGGAAYGKYFFQFADKMENVGIYDLETKKLLTVVPFPRNELYHCNNADFGAKFYAEGDEFPLLYVSMEHIDAHCALALRVQKNGNDFAFTTVQTIVYPDPRTAGIYYPNCIIDGENDCLYLTGYTQNSYNKSRKNKLVFTRFALPDLSVETVRLDKKDVLDQFTTDSITATQGALSRGGKIYQVYGFDGASSFRILDPSARAYIATVHLPKHKFPSEPESLFFFNGKFHCVDVRGDVFAFSFNE